MKIDEITARLDGILLVPGAERDIASFYAGDFLSRVMGRAPAGGGWLTVMNNVNVAGVAVLAELWCIIICEGVQPTEPLVERCREESIALITTALDVYCCCRLLP